ncbi:MAG: glycosyltransferase family 2 protein [Planctomycetota bacterium]|jgi:glycosyltransferase involved in cell wall biosynthesis|nr:glycosyltransferase family 2 protein [Planctomycetota bacterium]MDP7253054.1 glycosyltransferase family 2 protein [Planctomycetota bacterium]
MSMETLISIVTPTFNRSAYLGETIQSVLDQDYQNFEHIVVDDGSTDNTHEVVEEFSDTRLRFVPKKHSGVSSTRNRGIEEAEGDFILWLDSDDVLLPDALSNHVSVINEFPKADVFYGHLIYCDASLNKLHIAKLPEWYGKTPALLELLPTTCPISNPATMVRAVCYEWFGDYDESFLRAEDYEMWARLAKFTNFKLVDNLLAKYRVHESSLSNTNDEEIDTSFEARVVQNLVERHSLEELFPSLKWGSEPSKKLEANAYFALGEILERYSDLPMALHYAQRSHSLFPNDENSNLLNRIQNAS